MPHYSGLFGPAKAVQIAELLNKDSVTLIVCKDLQNANDLFSDLNFLLGFERALRLYPAWDVLPYEQSSPEIFCTADRLKALVELAQNKSLVLIAPIQALSQKILTKEQVLGLCFSISLNARYSRNRLQNQLENAGFRRVRMVEQIGDYTAHGQIVDFYSNNYLNPIRVEIVNETITAIKFFNLETQRSISDLETADIYPLREYSPFSENSPNHSILQQALTNLKERAEKVGLPLRERQELEELVQKEKHFQGSEILYPIFDPNLADIFSYLPKAYQVFVDDDLGVVNAQEHYSELIQERFEQKLESQEIVVEPNSFWLEYSKIKNNLDLQNIIYLDSLEVNIEDLDNAQDFHNFTSFAHTELRAKLTTAIGSGNAFEPLKKQITEWRRRNEKILFTAGSSSRIEKLIKLLADLKIDCVQLKTTPIQWLNNPISPDIAIHQGRLSQGIRIPKKKLVLVSEEDIFNKRSTRKKKKSETLQLKKLMQALSQLELGDYIVHEDYGVGIYQGLKQMTVEDVASDFLQIDYADSVLYLPVQHIGKIQKYRGKDGVTPECDKLSSQKWQVTKRKIRDQVVSLAGDLIKLYATRNTAKGWRFDPFGAVDEDFAEEFPYNETQDQLQAIHETVKDMSSDKPMDRLICGDVGFGKTEVAIRATYKCLQHARQVAILAPTTILVEQHYQNFKERFSNYPFRIKPLSRFYSAIENKKTIEELESGKVDLVIGTHKLLGQKIEFKDLGLLVIDEEQRFGVQQKERLKQVKKEVDVLTLTATPIPRTLHMALLNIRDISVITTPPNDRRLIKTYVATESDSLIREAIMRELQRQGQVFFLHNRVQSIDQVTATLSALVPEARFVYAHGQMSEKQLENIMRKFIRHDFDVLVSTSIIESGIDISNANTMIIDRADMFGLAQLYQLRGRVGRSDRQAYCYYLVPPRRKLNTEAQKRLKVLQSLDELGQGFQLALNDLEIRGAGNLLGKEQSGSVAAIGYDLYIKILKDAIANLKGSEEEFQDSIDPDVKLGVPAFIPDNYIPDISERLILYQRLAAIIQNEEAQDLAQEIADRFGPPSLEIENLIEIMRIRGLLRQFGVTKLERRGDKLYFGFHNKAPLDLQKLMDLAKYYSKTYQISNNLTLIWNIKIDQEDSILKNLYNSLHVLLLKIARDN